MKLPERLLGEAIYAGVLGVICLAQGIQVAVGGHLFFPTTLVDVGLLNLQP